MSVLATSRHKTQRMVSAQPSKVFRGVGWGSRGEVLGFPSLTHKALHSLFLKIVVIRLLTVRYFPLFLIGVRSRSVFR